MEDKEKEIQELLRRIEQLSQQQKIFQDQIQKLHQDAYRLKNPDRPASTERNPETIIPVQPPVRPTAGYEPVKTPIRASQKQKSAWEEFIGENLLNKVGIAVLVVGIGFGAKYSIDHELIDPLTRIILGYMSGIILLGIALPLKERHQAFSAVLLSGGMATLYFITYAAYTFYGLLPQTATFIMMVLFTAFTVFASMQYNLQVIAVIGLAGAYAVPLLLSDGSGRVVILFSYISIINCGILFLSFKRYWKALYYTAFVLTWITFASWYAFAFDRHLHASTSMLFSTLFFLIFYTAFLSYKLIRKETLGRWDVVCMLFNSFIYFGYGYLTIDAQPNGEEYLGLFTVLTALMHFGACLVIYKTQKTLGDSFYFVAGMVLVFITIAVPVQLEGNWVTLVWAAESALLFRIGRAKTFPVYERISYPLICLAFLSLLHDWYVNYPGFYYFTYEEVSPFRIFLNIQFLTSMLVGASFTWIFFMSKTITAVPGMGRESSGQRFLLIGLPLLALIVIYFGFYKEIEAFWNHRYAGSRIELSDSASSTYNQFDTALLEFKVLWLIIYSAFFATVLCILQVKWKTRVSGLACMVINAFVLLVFITSGLLSLTALRSGFLTQDLAQYYDRGAGHLIIRYMSVAAMLPLLWFNFSVSRQRFFNDQVRMVENLFFHFVTLVLLSSELVHWLELARVENTFKLFLTILWGGYALFLIVLGLSRDEKHIRVAAIILFAVTLLKLFVYDMEDMSTILKTIVMIILGVLLLTASFIYNKYKRSAGNEAQ